MNSTFCNVSELEVLACGKTHTIYSNEACTQKIVIKIEKFQDKQCVFEGDHIEYTIKIFNESKIDIDDAIFVDDIPNGLKYVNNTFTVDKHPETPQQSQFDNKISFKINKIKKESEVEIKFEVVVL